MFILAKGQPAYHRFLYKEIDFSERLIGIKGARGSGKTTLILQFAKNSGLKSSQILYLSCDHPAMAEGDLYNLAQTFYQEGGKLLLLDEIHKFRNFATHLKAIYDTFELKVIFSGSSALRIEHELVDLSRRAIVFELPVLSFREFLEIETQETYISSTLEDILNDHVNIATTITQRIRPIEYYKRYLSYGAYPFYKESIKSYTQKLTEIINITIDSDLCGIYNIEPLKLDKLKKILYMLCITNPVELNISKLSSAVGTSWPTLSKYLERMDAGSLIHIIRGGTGMRSVNKPDKLLLDNPNLFYTLCATPNIGSIRESFFISQVSYSHPVHYHDKGDFIIDDDIIFEIGGASKPFKQIANTKKAFLAVDDIETGNTTRIPLWLLGMLY
ncbi:MAG: AAA family ATPase [Methylococcales bacterium]